ncbi:DUF6809 family protein [Clostridium perfringens]|uniref:DUF6809 family protein n=1 Tax=Clostridium perfringens TaxID=1502 RepID=UPI0024BCD5B1|nr:DUF6809 family protein [Clostridium perfringens]
MNIEFEKMQKLLSEIIEREMSVELEYDFKYMGKEESNKQGNISDRVINLYDKLNCILSEEDKELLREFVDLTDELKIMEIKYYFERGVRSGLSSLSYLKEYFHIF